MALFNCRKLLLPVMILLRNTGRKQTIKSSDYLFLPKFQRKAPQRHRVTAKTGMNLLPVLP